jgi:hypothetical protein
MNTRNRSRTDHEGPAALVVLVILLLCAVGMLIMDRHTPRKSPGPDKPLLLLEHPRASL